MLLMVIVAALATPAFYRRAKSLGLSPGRAASLPFIVLGIFLIVAFLTGNFLVYLAERMSVGDGTANLIASVFDFLMVAAYFLFIRRNWKILGQQNPDDK